jgi:uncharacterized damage-inducible protein DinB
MDHLKRLMDHLAWADERVLASLRQARVSHPAAIALYAHILGAEHAWMSRILGTPPVFAIWPQITLDECESQSAENVKALRSFVSTLTPNDRQKQITYRNSAGAEFTTGLEDILLHVALHGSYHRGQVAAILRGAGDEPAPTDYIQWVRGTAAAVRS